MNTKITKSNALNEASYKLSLNEQRLVLLFISQINSFKPVKKDGFHTVSAKEFSETFHVDIKKAYIALKDASDRLFEKKIFFLNSAGEEIEKFRWCYHCKYNVGYGTVSIAYSPSIIKHLSLFTDGKFISYDLTQIAKINSMYSIRIYELIKQVQNTQHKYKEMTVKEFRDCLKVSDLYPRYFDLNKRVIAPAIKDINRYTDIHVELEAIKKGRNISTLKFHLSKSSQQNLPL